MKHTRSTRSHSYTTPASEQLVLSFPNENNQNNAVSDVSIHYKETAPRIVEAFTTHQTPAMKNIAASTSHNVKQVVAPSIKLSGEELLNEFTNIIGSAESRQIVWRKHIATFEEVYKKIYEAEQKIDQSKPFPLYEGEGQMQAHVLKMIIEILEPYKTGKTKDFKYIRKSFPSYIYRERKDQIVGFSSLLGFLLHRIDKIRALSQPAKKDKKNYNQDYYDALKHSKDLRYHEEDRD